MARYPLNLTISQARLAGEQKRSLQVRLPKQGLKGKSKTTAEIIFDNGWHLSFRIHNAESRIIPSLKFDVQIVGGSTKDKKSYNSDFWVVKRIIPKNILLS